MVSLKPTTCTLGRSLATTSPVASLTSCFTSVVISFAFYIAFSIASSSLSSFGNLLEGL